MRRLLPISSFLIVGFVCHFPRASYIVIRNYQRFTLNEFTERLLVERIVVGWTSLNGLILTTIGNLVLKQFV